MLFRHMNYCSASLIIFKNSKQNHDEVPFSFTSLTMIRERRREREIMLGRVEGKIHYEKWIMKMCISYTLLVENYNSISTLQRRLKIFNFSKIKLHRLLDPTILRLSMVLQIYDHLWKWHAYKDIHCIAIAKMENNFIRDYLILNKMNKLYYIHIRKYFRISKKK